MGRIIATRRRASHRQRAELSIGDDIHPTNEMLARRRGIAPLRQQPRRSRTRGQHHRPGRHIHALAVQRVPDNHLGTAPLLEVEMLNLSMIVRMGAERLRRQDELEPEPFRANDLSVMPERRAGEASFAPEPRYSPQTLAPRNRVIAAQPGRRVTPRGVDQIEGAERRRHNGAASRQRSRSWHQAGQRPHEVGGQAHQRITLYHGLPDAPQIHRLQITDAAVDDLQCVRRRLRAEIILLQQYRGHAAPRCLPEQRAAVDTTSHDGQIVALANVKLTVHHGATRPPACTLVRKPPTQRPPRRWVTPPSLRNHKFRQRLCENSRSCARDARAVWRSR